MDKLIAVIVLAGMVIGLGWGIHNSGYNSGVSDEKVKNAEDINKSRKAELKAVADLIEERKKRKVKTNVKIKDIKEAFDPSGCLDTSYSDLGVLRKHD